MNKADFLKSIQDKMTIEQKIGQCVVVGMSGTHITNDVREAISRYHCSGLRLSGFMRMFRYFSDDKAKKGTLGSDYKPSLEKITKQGIPQYVSPEQYAAMLNELRDLAAERDPAIPLHMVIDQEGDTSRDFARGGVVQFPSNMGLAASNDPDMTYRTAKMIAKEMKASGFNMIHSPVVDVNINPQNPEIGRRAFSDDPEVVARHAIAMVKGFKEEGIIAAAKHFPGRGDSATDAHHACPVLNVDKERMHEVELYPYKKLIEAGIDSIMVAHCIYPAYDDKISTVSKRIITGLLREELGFEGLITTDSMTMGALIDRYGVGEACAMALSAGADTVLMKAENQWRGETFYTIRKWVEDGRITEKELDEKVSRILSIKYDIGLFDSMGKVDASRASEPYRDPVVIKTAEEAAEKAVMVVKDDNGFLPVDKTKKTLLINQLYTVKTPNDSYDHPSYFSELMEAEWPGLQSYETSFGFESEEEEKSIVEYAVAGGYEQIICTNFYDRSEKPHTYVKTLIEKGLPVILITNTPYCIGGRGGLIPEAGTIILDMNLTPEGLRAARNVLEGRIKGKAVWPLKNYDPFKLRTDKK